jgi:hypothetical protein
MRRDRGRTDVHRRDLLALSAGALAAGAGCLGSDAGESATTTRAGAVDAPSMAERGRPPDVCERDPGPSDIVAVEEPAFAPEWPADVPELYGDLGPETTVVGLRGPESARAYPLPVLVRHEVVNDDVGGPVLVTFCPLCRSGLVAQRRVDGAAATFDVSGLLWKPPRIQVAASEEGDRVFSDRESGPSPTRNLVMVDRRTGSLWSQLLAQAICGPATGERLTVRPSTLTTWGEWRRRHDDATVLLPPPASGLTRPDDAAAGVPDE